MSDIDLDLEELFRAARAAHKAERALFHKAQVKKTPKADQIPVDPLGVFANPENWTEGRGLALIHQETKIFLGNFREMLHVRHSDARRLVRSLEPIHIDAVEEVAFGLPENQQPLPASNRLVTQRIIEGPIELVSPSLLARGMLCVHYYDGATARAILVETTTFASGDELWQLPAGVDLLPLLSTETKRAIRSL